MKNFLLLIIAFSSILSFNSNRIFIIGRLGRGEVTVNKNCDPSSIIENVDFNFSPEVIKPSVQINATVKSRAKSEVTLKQLLISINLNGKTLSTLSKDYGNHLNAGDYFNYDYQAKLPFYLPGGNYSIYINLVDVSGNKVSCALATFSY